MQHKEHALLTPQQGDRFCKTRLFPAKPITLQLFVNSDDTNPMHLTQWVFWFLFNVCKNYSNKDFVTRLGICLY